MVTIPPVPEAEDKGGQGVCPPMRPSAESCIQLRPFGSACRFLCALASLRLGVKRKGAKTQRRGVTGLSTSQSLHHATPRTRQTEGHPRSVLNPCGASFSEQPRRVGCFREDSGRREEYGIPQRLSVLTKGPSPVLRRSPST